MPSSKIQVIVTLEHVLTCSSYGTCEDCPLVHAIEEQTGLVDDTVHNPGVVCGNSLDINRKKEGAAYLVDKAGRAIMRRFDAQSLVVFDESMLPATVELIRIKTNVADEIKNK